MMKLKKLIDLEDYLQDSEIISNALLYVSDSTLNYSFVTEDIEDKLPQLIHMYCVYTLIANKQDDVDYINELHYVDIDNYYTFIDKLDVFFTNCFNDISNNTDKTINKEIVYKLFKYLYIEINTINSEYQTENGFDLEFTNMIEFINTSSETFNFPYDYAFYDSFSGVYNNARKSVHKYKIAADVDKIPKFSIEDEDKEIDKVDKQISESKQISDTPKAVDNTTSNDILNNLHTDMQLIKAMLVNKDNETINDKKVDAVYNVLELFETSVDKQLIKKILELYNRL